MTDKPTGGPAYPTSGVQGVPYFPGMSLRDWFAGQALAGLAQGFCGSTSDVNWFQDRGAEAAYRIADAMLTERGQ